ncbi:MAG: energy transducer TonB, partial [Paramuribaculum sp.]|nr:energy transducer TonB [Paramuribaculum sp.]
ADILCIVLWYNPSAWMTKQLMKLNHEFEADHAVISSGIETYDYQRMLVTKAMGMRAFPVANSLAADGRNFRKRVLNISRRRSPKRTMLIAIFAIPAFIISWTVISFPVSAGLLEAISDFRFSKEPSTADIDEQLTPVAEAPNVSSEETDSLTVIPSPIEDQTALAEIIRLSLETINPDKDTKVNIEIVVDKDGRVKDVSTNNPDGAQLVAAIDRQLNGIKFEQMTDDGQPVEVRFNIPVSFKAQE